MLAAKIMVSFVFFPFSLGQIMAGPPGDNVAGGGLVESLHGRATCSLQSSRLSAKDERLNLTSTGVDGIQLESPLPETLKYWRLLWLRGGISPVSSLSWRNRL